jgi:hypothetical protein
VTTSFDKAAQLAKTNRCPQVEALAYELTFRFYHSIGASTFSEVFLDKALAEYESWGAVQKVSFSFSFIFYIF